MAAPTTAVFYAGPSQLNGAPIVAIATGLKTTSKNKKTGAMVQTWILRSDKSPTEAVRSGDDDAICGECKMRGDGAFGRTCYVVWWQGPQNVYKTLDRLSFIEPSELSRMLRGRHVRIGTYGDPAAVPFANWSQLVKHAAGWTGYTHQWPTCAAEYRTLLMASVDSETEKTAAAAMGWRTFRCRTSEQSVLEDEVICPASAEAGHSTTCDDCRLCRGTSRQAKSVAIVSHGVWSKHFIAPRIGESDRIRYIPLKQMA